MNNKKFFIGVGILIILSFLPLVFSIFKKPSEANESTQTSTLDNQNEEITVDVTDEDREVFYKYFEPYSDLPIVPTEDKSTHNEAVSQTADVFDISTDEALDKRFEESHLTEATSGQGGEVGIIGENGAIGISDSGNEIVLSAGSSIINTSTYLNSEDNTNNIVFSPGPDFPSAADLSIDSSTPLKLEPYYPAKNSCADIDCDLVNETPGSPSCEELIMQCKEERGE